MQMINKLFYVYIIILLNLIVIFSFYRSKLI